jgi:hypothetical protein
VVEEADPLLGADGHDSVPAAAGLKGFAERLCQRLAMVAVPGHNPVASQRDVIDVIGHD